MIARSLIGHGWSVALVGRREEALSATAHERKGVLLLPADITDPTQVDDLFVRVHEAWGRLDLLVNNAGWSGPSGTPDEIDVEEWRRTVEVNLTGSFLCARAAFALMRAQDPQGGRIINNGSVSAHAPRAGSAAYTASKHAVTGLTRATALDGRPFKIACGQIDIGNAATEMTAGIATGVPQADGTVRAEPTFDARHAADAVRFMAELPLDANTQFLTLTATAMPFVGRG
ncbi:oxidoreductase [Streptomyces albus]|nr:oxidoreductase [Streptomyces albus]